MATPLNLTLRTGGATHRGAHRDNNEDSMAVAGSLCVVADGMGGHEAGEVASRLCVRQLAYSHFYSTRRYERRRTRKLPPACRKD